MGNSAARRSFRRPGSLLAQVMFVNVFVLLVAGGALILTPASVSDPVALEELVLLVGGVATLVLANLFLLRRAFAPLHRLTDVMARVEHLRTGLRIPVYGGGQEIVSMTRAFNPRPRAEVRHQGTGARGVAS